MVSRFFLQLQSPVFTGSGFGVVVLGPGVMGFRVERLGVLGFVGLGVSGRRLSGLGVHRGKSKSLVYCDELCGLGFGAQG